MKPLLFESSGVAGLVIDGKCLAAGGSRSGSRDMLQAGAMDTTPPRAQYSYRTAFLLASTSEVLGPPSAVSLSPISSGGF